MNKFKHSAHPVLLIGERCVKRCRHFNCSYSYGCLQKAITLTRQSLDESSSAYLC